MQGLVQGEQCFVAIITRTSTFGKSGEIFTCPSEVEVCEATFCGWSKDRHSEVDLNGKKYSSRWDKDKILAVSLTEEGAWKDAKEVLALKIESVAHCVFASGSNLEELLRLRQEKHNDAVNAFLHCKELAQKLDVPLPERHLYRTVLSEKFYKIHYPSKEVSS